jgi:hypothetical protein
MNKTTLTNKTAPAAATGPTKIETDAGSLADGLEGPARWSTLKKARGQIRREFLVSLVHSQLTAAGSALASHANAPAAEPTDATAPAADDFPTSLAKAAWDVAEAALREGTARGFLP